MAQLGIRKFDDLIGRADLLDMRKGIEHWKAGPGLQPPVRPAPGAGRGAAPPRRKQDHGLDKALDVR
jgi:glutamate synthase (NADPH/NADH) large chain/glutamate synthase (ferredoxin)